MNRFVVLVICGLASCVPAATPLPPRSPVVEAVPPSCAGLPDEVPTGELGSEPIRSESDVAAAVGHTLYLTKSKDFIVRSGAFPSVHAVFGEPVLLCAARYAKDRGKNDPYAASVLVKTPGGTLIQAELGELSTHAPHFSLYAPTDAVAMLVGAYHEAHDAKARLDDIDGTPPTILDRTAPGFWTKIVYDQAHWTRSIADQLVVALVRGLGEDKRQGDRAAVTVTSGSAGVAQTENRQPWIDRADGTVQAWMQFGIPRGPVRAAYEQVQACMQDNFVATSKKCEVAEAVVRDPPQPPPAATSGGKLEIHLPATRSSGPQTLEVDGKPVEITGSTVAVDVAVDGPHKVHVTAARMKTFDRTVDVRYGAAIAVVVTFLPR